MGVETELFIASDAELERLAGFPTVEGFVAVDLNGLDEMMLAALAALIREGKLPPDSGSPTYDGALDELSNALNSAPGEDAWVYPMPESLAAMLRELPDETVAALADEWSAWETIQVDGYADSAGSWLTELVQFARRAESTQKRLYLFRSL